MEIRVNRDDVSICHDTFYTYITIPDGVMTMPSQPVQTFKDIDSDDLINALVKYHKDEFRDYINDIVSVDCDPQIYIDL